MRILSCEDIIKFHAKIIKDTGGSLGIRDKGLIESSINRALMTYDSKDLYPETIDKIAVTGHALVCNHCFVDGNKRIGIAVMLLLLKINNIKIYYTQNELVGLGLNVAEGLIKEQEISRWIKEHIID
ncbi:MAG: type II toxin-antitoxin system death-on-curing family toxin [Desulfitobacteriaceae bacterium]|nr:type II toxin-antitoxin system death-on-curing family toxin [Desulfitobacteriaceae bacterium]